MESPIDSSEIIPPMQFHSEIDEIFGKKVDRIFSSVRAGAYVYLQFSDDPSFLLCAEILQMERSRMLLKYQNGNPEGVWCRFELGADGVKKLRVDESSYGLRSIADYCFVRHTLPGSERGCDRSLDSRMTWVNLVDVGHRNNPGHKEYDNVYRETDVYCIPDIHGDLGYLRRSLFKQDIVDEQDEWVAGNRVVVFLGDYIDEPDGLKVMDYLVSLSEKAAKAGGCVKLLCGNHDAEAFGAMVACDFDFHGDYESRNASRISGMTPNFLRGGGKEFVTGEVSKRYGVTDIPSKLIRVLKGSGCFEFIKSLDLCAQVDDILFVHAGIDVESSRMIRELGADGVNKIWREALALFEQGLSDNFGSLNRASVARVSGVIDVCPSGKGGMLWFDAVNDLGVLKPFQIQEICENLKSRGINVVAVGHTVFEKVTLVVLKDFEKYGIKIICADVGGSDVVGFKGATKYRRPDELRGRTSCGIKVDRSCRILGAPVSFDDDPVDLYTQVNLMERAGPVRSVYNTVNQLVKFAVPSRERIEHINGYDFAKLKTELALCKEAVIYYKSILDNPGFAGGGSIIVTGDYGGELQKKASKLLGDPYSPESRVLIEVLIMHRQSQIELMEKRLLRVR